MCASFGKAAAPWDYDAVTLTAAYGSPYFSLGCVANTAKQIEIRYHEPDLFLTLCRSGLFMWFRFVNISTVNMDKSMFFQLAADKRDRMR